MSSGIIIKQIGYLIGTIDDVRIILLICAQLHLNGGNIMVLYYYYTSTVYFHDIL